MDNDTRIIFNLIDSHSITTALRCKVTLQLCRVCTIKDIAHNLQCLRKGDRQAQK